MLTDVERERVDELWCLGDVVGYGPRPNECVAAVRDRVELALCGNHDLAVLGVLDLAEFSADAAVAARWTQGVLDDDGREWLGRLEPAATRPEAELYHGSPRDPVWDYVISEQIALQSLELTSAPLVLVGHSHVAVAVACDGDGVAGGLAPAETTVDLAAGRWLLNPGSVGQPRDGDPRAAWLLIDFGAGRAAFRRVPYPIAETQAELAGRGLPPALAARLQHGV